ncbi:MAG: hypothetical protein ACRDH8_02695 [Actinomycetota bacterium]
MSSRERNMLIILGVLAVAALAFFLLTSGDEEPEEAAAPTPDTSSPAVTTPPEPQEEEEEAEQAVDFLGGRDPFDPLVVEVEGGGEAPTDDTTTGDTTTGDTTTGDTTTGDTTTGDTTTGGTGSEGETEDVTLTGRPVTLVSISSRGSKDVAQVEVDGQTFTVSEGQRFSRHFELVSISRHCARFLYGDQSFSLCEEVAPR